MVGVAMHAHSVWPTSIGIKDLNVGKMHNIHIVWIGGN